MNSATLTNGTGPQGQMLFSGRHPAAKMLVNGQMRSMSQVDKETGDVFYFNRAGVLISNSMLSEKEWVEYDRKLIAPATYPLKLMPRIRAKGLIKPLGGIGSLLSTWSTLSDITGATINMTGQGNGERDLPDQGQAAVPVPVIFKEFGVDARSLAASRNLGDAIDTTTLGMARRVVDEKVEDLVMNGASVKLNGFSLYGLRNHPGRLTSTAAGDFGTIANILPTINAMILALQNALFSGRYSLFLSQAQYLELTNQYYGTDSNITPLSRIKENDLIESVDWLPPQVLPSGELLMVQMDDDTIDVAEALPLSIREWTSGDGWQTSFKVLTVLAPRIKSRYDGVAGIAHWTGA